MTIRTLLDYVQAVKPSSFTDEQMLVWINELEARVQMDVMQRWPGEILQYSLPENENTELLLTPPHDACYRYYLQAMIDYENGEYNRYANTSQMFNASWNDFVAWFAEKYRPADGYIKWPDGIIST